MSYEEFAAAAARAFEEIPPEFRERVQGPVVLRDAKRHREVRGMLTLGECVHAPDFSGPGELWSTVFLYYGSFEELARRDPSFDVEAEIVETVRHEVQHHVEDMVGHPGLRDLDWAEEQNERRLQGRPYAPRFWRAGERVGGEGGLDEDVRAVGADLFLELELRPDEWERARRQGLDFTVGGEEYEIDADELREDEEVFEFEACGREDHGGEVGDLVLVVRRRRGFFETTKPKQRAERKR
jgi:predicted Zn-dependent protease with MMP-like domain